MVRRRADRSRPHAVENDDDASAGLDCVSWNTRRARPEGGDPGQEGNVLPGQVGPQDTLTLRAVGQGLLRAAGQLVHYCERALATTVQNIEHIESQPLHGRGIVKELC